MGRMNSSLRYRPYRRSVSLRRASSEIVDCDDDLDDTILVLYDGVRHPPASAAAGTTGQPAGAALVTGGAAALPGAKRPSQSPVDVSDATLPAETPDVSVQELSTILPEKTLTGESPGGSPATRPAAAAGRKDRLTVDECFSPFVASPAVVPAVGASSAKRPRSGRIGLVTSTPAVVPVGRGGRSSSASRRKLGRTATKSPRARRSGPATSTPAARRQHDGSVVEVTPCVITLEDDDPSALDGDDLSVLEVTEVRRVIRLNTPAQPAANSTCSRQQRRTPRRRAAATSTPATSAAFSEDLTPAVKKSAPVTKAELGANFLPLETADLSSSLEEGELSRSHRRPRRSDSSCRPAGGAARRVRPLRRTSSTQRRLQSVVRVARRTLAPPLSADAKRRHRDRRLSDRGTPARRRGKPLKRAQGSKWTVDLRGSRFAAPLGASDQPILFTPEFSESFAQMLAERPKRPIVVDGPNVAYAHGRDQVCSVRGIQIVLDYFKNLGHRCTVFLPSGFISRARNEENIKMLEEMYRRGDLTYTPSRVIGNRVISSYDDRYVVMYATRVGGVIVSRDLYRDVAAERPDWQHTIENRLLIPAFVGDELLLPPDPLGRNGPGLHEFLTFPPGTSPLLTPENQPIGRTGPPPPGQ